MFSCGGEILRSKELMRPEARPSLGRR